MVSSFNSISSLTPVTFRTQLRFKVIELVISLVTKHEATDSTITIHEYLVADETGCIILNTKSALEINNTFEVTEGHTRVIEGSLRLYSNQLKPSTEPLTKVNTENNRSFIQLERKI